MHVPDTFRAQPGDLLCAKCGAPHARAARFCRLCGHRHGTSVAGQLVVREPAEVVAAATPTAKKGQAAKRRQAAKPRPPVESWAILVDERTGMLQLPAELTAERTFSPTQVRAFAIAGFILLAAFFVQPIATLTALVAGATFLYLGSLAYRMKAFFDALRAPEEIHIDDDEARAVPDAALPVYTVLVPAYKEPEVIAHLIASIEGLDYPRDKLDVKLLLEMDDLETFEVARRAIKGDHIQIVRVPPSVPRTKPKACNYGLMQARGEFLTIYDAEDEPDPLQLRRAAIALARTEPSVACLQAKLAYRNANQNLLTRWFTTEYAMWFSQLLPGLVAQGAPIPLGGTSNHFRREILERVGAWDAFNVTEDADLGIRLHRLGYSTRVLDSTTLEEANSDFVNWIKQRSRWYKGYMQTWLVHMREPLRVYRALGPRAFVGFNLFVLGTPLLALINPIFWALTILWFLTNAALISSLFPSWLYYLGLFSMVVGNCAVIYSSIVSARATGNPELVLAAMLSPIYWVMMSIAAIKALVQLISAPSFWEKTTHGLDQRAVDRSQRALP
jgi:cellulose synthase/poly-beta-1,6-N-acetylglucosamine synthase-like glycosyltransferase